MKYTHNTSNKWKASFKWHKWFAWYPVSDGNTLVWLDYIWRKRESSFHEVYWKYSFDKSEEE